MNYFCNMVKLEVCANSVQSAIAAQRGGAIRVELCSNLSDGGTTPAKSQIELTRANIEIDLNVIIRPRGGDFFYDDLDFETMQKDIRLCGELQCDGVVIGILDAKGNIDIERNRILVDLARRYGLSVTFHRAFDRCDNLHKALDDVIKLGCDRVLTSGGYVSAFEGREVLRSLVDQAQSHIIIMAGAGINESNVLELVEYTGVKEIHGTFQRLVEGGMNFHSPQFTDRSEYSHLLSDSDKINQILRIING